MKNRLLALPLKETVNVSIRDGVLNIIDEKYHQSSSQFKTQLDPIDDLRDKIKSNVINLNSIVILKRYFNFICQLEEKFPQGIEFSWFNSLNDSSTLTKNKSFRFEKIMIIYQISSMYSNLALNEIELKTIGVYFQYSAGCLELIINDFELNGEIEGIDLTLNSIKSLYYLTLSQSQEIYWLKAKNDSIRDTVLIKLSKQISIFYEKSYEFSKISDQFNSKWCNYLQVKALHFESSTLFRYSQYLSCKGKFGDEISYLKQADLILNNQPNECLNDEVLQDSKNLQIEIEKRLKIAERENDLIHLQEIPDFNDFKTIPNASLAKPVIPRELTDEYLKENKDLKIFDLLVPISVIEKCETFKMELNEYITLELFESIQYIISDVDNFLNESQVHSQLDSIIPQNIPETIIQCQYRIFENGSADKIINKMNKLNGLRVKCKNELDLIMDRVEKRAPPIEDDKNYNLLLKNFRTFQQYIIQSEKGDLTINKQIEDLKPFLDLFKSIESLNEFLPNPDIENFNPELIHCVGKLKTIINEFNQLKDQCMKLRDSINLKLIKLNNEMMNEAINGFNKSNEVILNNEMLTTYMNKFDPEVSKMNEIKSIESNTKLDFNSSFQRFLTLKSNLIISKEREDALNVLNSTFNGYFEIVNNLNQGFEFYLNLQGRIKQEETTFNEYLNI